jgi:NADH/NAD ratio-sensing transcriptional regulator Rex
MVRCLIKHKIHLRDLVLTLAHYFITNNESFQNVSKFQYREKIIPNRTRFLINYGMKNLRNGCLYYSEDRYHIICVSKTKDQGITNEAIILPLVVYGCKIWSFTLRKECKLQGSVKKVLSKT